jgi:hypothetical protein
MLPSLYFGSTKWSHAYIAARRRKDAQAVLADVSTEGDVEHLYVDLADIAAHPLVEDDTQKTAVLFRFDGSVGDLIALLGVERAWIAAALAPTDVGDR